MSHNKHKRHEEPQDDLRPDGSVFGAMPVDVLPDGRLLLQTEQGEVAFSVKELVCLFS